MPKVRGRRRHVNRLNGMRRRTAEAAGQAIFAAGSLIEVEARTLIVAGAIQGAGHVPSAPGEPPNREFGDLDASIHTQKTGRLTSEVRVDAPHGLPLEFGAAFEDGRVLEERPFMRPATKNKRPAAERLVARAVRGAIRRSR